MRPSTFPRLRLRHLVVWWLAFVLPVQVLAVGVMQARGPSHTHESRVTTVADASLLAADFRRNLGRSVGAAPPIDGFAAVLHGHPHAQAERHYHAFDDTSVHYADGDRFADPGREDGGPLGDASGSGFVPIPAVAPIWSESGQRAEPEPRRVWTPTAAARARLERPPRSQVG